LVENLKGTDHLEDQDIDGRIILNCSLNKQGERVWNGFDMVRIGSCGGCL
jgi:hypothetical protein